MGLKNDSVLVLNKYLLAIQVSDVKSSICALVANKVRVIDEQYRSYNLQDWVKESARIEDTEEANKYSCLVRSPTIKIYAPQVVIAYDCEFNCNTMRVIKYSRQNIYKRDAHTCQYCRKKLPREDLTLDHVVPRSRGGKSTWTNVVACCKVCNEIKGNSLVSELGWVVPPPKKPAWRSHIGVPFNRIKKQFWENFLS